MAVFASFNARLAALLALLPLALCLSSCDLLAEDAGEPPLLEVEYRVVASGESGATHVYGIFYVDDQGQETTLTQVPLPWSYTGSYPDAARIAASIAQRNLGEGYRAIKLEIYRDGVLSTEMEAGIDGGTNIVGFDSSPSAQPWGGP